MINTKKIVGKFISKDKSPCMVNKREELKKTIEELWKDLPQKKYGKKGYEIINHAIDETE